MTGIPLTIKPAGIIKGTLTVPGDKSISHRAVILGAIAEGRTAVKNLLEGEDVLHTVEILRELGVLITKKGDRWIIEGRGLHGLIAPSKILDCGNSGTTLRLVTGLLAGFSFTSSLTGDASLNRRPMDRVIEPLTQMGASLREVRQGESRILYVAGGGLAGGTFRLPVASAQLKSALLLAGLYAKGEVTVIEPFPSRDHTERMLKAFGARLQSKGNRITLRPPVSLKAPQRLVVPGDFSSAAFFMVATLIHPNPKSRLTIRNVGLNPTRTGALDVLKKMGAKILIKNRRTVGDEPVGDLNVFPSSLKGTKIGGSLIPRLIDEIPILAIAAAVAKGTTEIRDAKELRIKESDRITTLATELSRWGVSVKELPDGLRITGAGKIKGGAASSHGDHRIAMSMAVLATIAGKPSVIEDVACINTSFPQFPFLINHLTNLKNP